MQLLDITYDSVIENIALDEALLLYSEQTGEEFLRFWKPQHNTVVMGRSGKLEQEAAKEYCRKNQIPVYRRPSGGGTILTLSLIHISEPTSPERIGDGRLWL